jgi:hypothetical protein
MAWNFVSNASADAASDAATSLGNRTDAIAPLEFATRSADLDVPGLYSWWADDAGRDELGDGLGGELPALIYAGQAGATTNRSRTRRPATLRSRILTNHIRGNIRGSTFRLTIAAVLRAPLRLDVLGPRRLSPESNRRLSEWIGDHLSVVAWPFHDRDALAELEHQVLTTLDPPLNLDGMPPSPVRARLSALRSEIARGDAPDDPAD